MIGTLYPPISTPEITHTSAATHVSIVAIMSTLSRLLFGTITDLLAPPSASHHFLQSASNSLASLPPRPSGFTISRIPFLMVSGLFLSLGQSLLASGLIQDHGERFWMVSTLIGSGYGSIFSLTPLVISIVWGVENFGTNWGVVAMFPALGATFWGVVYSKVYQWGAEKSVYGKDVVAMAEDILCYGKQCYESTFWGMAASSWIGCACLLWAWKGPGGWSSRGIAV